MDHSVVLPSWPAGVPGSLARTLENDEVSHQLGRAREPSVSHVQKQLHTGLIRLKSAWGTYLIYVGEGI